MKAVSEAAHLQNDATARAVQESAAAGATTATVRGRHTEKTKMKDLAEAAIEENLELVMTADEGATIEEAAEMIAPASAPTHHNHRKAPVAAVAAHSVAPLSPPQALATQPTPMLEKRRPTWR